jgi:hypothetical protein
MEGGSFLGLRRMKMLRPLGIELGRATFDDATIAAQSSRHVPARVATSSLGVCITIFNTSCTHYLWIVVNGTSSTTIHK